MERMIGRDPHTQWLGGCNGACCNTRAQTRTSKKAVKQAEKRETARLAEEARSEDLR